MADVIVDFPGLSGRAYRYWQLAGTAAQGIISANGNYMFVKQLANGNWLPIYIGQADDLKARIPTHERWADARRAGATHVMAHTTPAGEQARLDEERDLIAYWGPQLNTHHRQTP
jgi:hypothetical protein